MYRIALALGLLALGLYAGREVARSRPARTAIKQARHNTLQRLTTAPRGEKTSVH